MLALMRTSSGELVLEPTQAALSPIRERLRQELGEGTWLKTVFLAVDEAVANIVLYSRATQLRFSYAWRDDRFEVTLADDGIPFNPLEAPHEEKEFEEFEFGGMGIGLILSVSDEVHYEWTGETNVLTLEFQRMED
jgi:anti-sigma regulatory factor (Ser/Thr protein kinase)